MQIKPYLKNTQHIARSWWLTFVILATQEAEIRRASGWKPDPGNIYLRGGKKRKPS
jgi:hypothetical protein